MKKFDLYLASAMCIIALVWFLGENIISSNGNTVRVYSNNSISEEFNLSDEGIHVIKDNGNELLTFEIKDEYVNVLSASCKDKLCVHQKKIKKSGESIVCLPNNIMIQIIDNSNNKDNSNEFDAITF